MQLWNAWVSISGWTLRKLYNVYFWWLKLIRYDKTCYRFAILKIWTLLSKQTHPRGVWWKLNLWSPVSSLRREISYWALSHLCTVSRNVWVCVFMREPVLYVFVHCSATFRLFQCKLRPRLGTLERLVFFGERYQIFLNFNCVERIH